MSRRKRNTTYQRRYNKPLYKGRIYKTKDSKGGHYARIYRKNTKKNKYWIIHFTDSNGRHRIKMKHQIDPNFKGKKNSYVYTQPSIIPYERFHDHYPRLFLRVHKDDRRLVKKIQKKKWWDPRASTCGSKGYPWCESIIIICIKSNSIRIIKVYFNKKSALPI